MYLREGYESWTVKISISARTTKNYGLTPLSGGQMATLEGRVTTDYAGIALPLSHAEVIVGGGFARTFTDANGFYALAGLPPGLYDSTVRQDGYRAASLSDVGFLDVQVGANQADKALAFSEHGPGIRGVVVDENNVPIENAVITILPPPQVRLPSPLAGAKSRTGGVADEGRRRTAAGATASDAAGTFQLNGVPDGERRIRIEVPGRGVFTNVISVSGNMEAVFSLTEASRIPYEWRTPYTNWLGRHFRTTTIGRTVEAGDTDGDGVPNWAEFVCGTDPTNRASVFAPRMETAGGGRSQFVMDVAATGRVYDVYWKTNLMQTAWQRAMLTMTGTPGRIALPTGGVHARGFYRAAVRLR
jgi:hypothetical protein